MNRVNAPPCTIAEVLQSQLLTERRWRTFVSKDPSRRIWHAGLQDVPKRGHMDVCAKRTVIVRCTTRRRVLVQVAAHLRA